MRERIEKYINASNEYVEKEKLNKDVIGIIVSGSIQYSTIDKNSDVDIVVILDSKCDYRERGNLWINDVEIEYFKNPPEQIKSYFEKEQKSPHTAHMLAFGEIVYIKSEVVNELVSMAKSIIERKPRKFNAIEIEFEKYFIDDYYKDFEDAILNRDILGAKIIRSKIINRSIDIFYRINQKRRGKDKKLSKEIESLSSEFNMQIQKALNENWDENTSLDSLRTEIEKFLGGRRTREWKLRSKLDI